MRPSLFLWYIRAFRSCNVFFYVQRCSSASDCYCWHFSATDIPVALSCQWHWHCHVSGTGTLMSVALVLSCQWRWPRHVRDAGPVMSVTPALSCQWHWHCHLSGTGVINRCDYFFVLQPSVIIIFIKCFVLFIIIYFSITLSCAPVCAMTSLHCISFLYLTQECFLNNLCSFKIKLSQQEIFPQSSL